MAQERTEGIGGGTPAEAATAPALAALLRYRRRGHPARSGVDCLLSRAATAPADARARRREELVERGVREFGLPRRFSEQVYDIAVEERVEPAFALDLVGCGVAVGRPTPEADGGEVSGPVRLARGAPEWLFDAVTAQEAWRERRLRSSFRRLRGLLERHATPESALRAFATEPDVDEAGY